MNNYQQVIQQTLKTAEDVALSTLSNEHQQAYLQLKQIINQQGTGQLSEDHKNYYNQMDQFIQQKRKEALDQLCSQNPAIARYCQDMESRKVLNKKQQTIDFESNDYKQQLHNYVQELCNSSPQEILSKLFTLYTSLSEKHYSKDSTIQHVQNVLTQLDMSEQILQRPDGKKQISMIWQEIQHKINQYDQSQNYGYQVFQYYNQNIKMMPQQIPPNVITYIVFSQKLMNFLTEKIKMGHPLPADIYARQGRPYQEQQLEFCTPVYINGQINQEVMHFFAENTSLITELQQASAQVYNQRDNYAQGANYQTQSNQYPYGQQYMRRSTNELSNDEYDHSDRQFTESSEFQEEEEVTEESEEQFNALTDNDDENEGADDEGSEGSGHDQSSGEELEDIEQDIENEIDEVLDLRIIPFEDSWKYPPSLMVKPEPEDIWKFDGLRGDQPLIPRSDGGYIMERLKLLEDDLVIPITNEPLNRDVPEKDQPKVYIFLIKWHGSSHIHATWELEAHIQHLNSYIKAKKFKHQFIDRQSLLASERLGQGYKDGLLEQLAEQQRLHRMYQVPERIVAFRNMQDKQATWNQSLQKVLDAIKKQGIIMSDGFDGAFVKGATDNMLHYYNQYQTSELDNKGYIINNTSTGVDQLRSEMYLIKWMDLPYQECTWELYEDLVAHPSIGKEVVRELRKQFKNSGKAIKTMLQQPDYCRFGSRKPTVENNDAHPDFLVDVTRTFKLRPYQIHGLNTLMHNWCNNRNMILCDPNNSGKSVQAIAFLSWLYHTQKVPGPFMIISTPTKMQSWQDHLATMFPDAQVIVLFGSKEDRRLIIENELIADGLHRFQILLTTQSAAQVEESHLRRFKWRMLLIDDAHIYRERENKRCRIFQSFTADAKLLLTSQPLATQVSEFYSLLHFIDPDQFHTQEIFTKLGQLEHFREALKRCEIQQQDGAGEAQLMKSVVVPLQQVKQSVQTVDTGADDALIATNRDDMMLSSDEESGGMPQGQAPNHLQNTYAGATLMAQGGESYDEKVDNIHKIIMPYLLVRDMKTISSQIKQSENDEKILFVNMTEEQQKVSREILYVNQGVLKNYSSDASKLQGIIKQLSKVSNHASIFKPSQIQNMNIDNIVNGSGKLSMILTLLQKYKQQKSKVLIYTQTQQTFALVERMLQLNQYKYQWLMDSQSQDSRSKAFSEFNKEQAEQFVFLYVTRPSNHRYPLHLQSVDKVIIIDTDINAFEDLNVLGVNTTSYSKLEVIRLATRKSVDEQIADIAVQRLILDYGLLRSSTSAIGNDINILRHIVQKGSEGILNGTAVSKETPDTILQNAKKLTYMHASEQEKQKLREDQFQENKKYDEHFWQNKFPDMPFVKTEGIAPNNQATQAQLQQIYELGCVCCGAEFITKPIGDLSPNNVAYILQQLFTEAEKAIQSAGVDCFNIPQDIYINYQGNKFIANKLFRAWLRMRVLQAHFENSTFRMPRNSFEIATFAVNWGYIHDHRLLSVAVKNGACVANYKQEIIEEIVCEVQLECDDLIQALQNRISHLLERLLRIQLPEKFVQELSNRGLFTQMQFETYNMAQAEQKEEELVKRFEQSGYQFPFAKDQHRTTFTIELQQKIFKLSLHQLQKFFTQSRRERISSIITRFYESTKSKLHYDDLRGISVLSGSARMKKKVVSQYDRFDITDADEGLLFKLYIQILNIVYSKTAIISQQCDEHIMSLRRRGGCELDNDTLVQEYVRDLFDYLYRLVWPTCNVQMLPTPFVLARICERNALDFDEGDIECGVEGDDVVVTMRRDKSAVAQAGPGDADMMADYD